MGTLPQDVMQSDSEKGLTVGYPRQNATYNSDLSSVPLSNELFDLVAEMCPASIADEDISYTCCSCSSSCSSCGGCGGDGGDGGSYE